MTISSPTYRGTASTPNSGTTLNVSPNAIIASGQLVIVRTASHGLVSHTVTGAFQTWTKIGELQDSTGTNKTVALHWCIVGAQISTSDVITLTLGSSDTGKVIAIEEYTCTGGTPTNVGYATAGGSSSSPSVTLGSLSSNDKVYIGALAVAQAKSFYTYTQDTDYSGDTKVGTDWGSQDSSSDMGYHSTTATSDTYNPTITSMPWAAILTAFEISAGSITVTPGTTNLTITAYAPVLYSGIIPATATLTLTKYAPLSLNGVYAIPNTATLTITPYAPVLATAAIPGKLALTLTAYAPAFARVVIPGTAVLVLTPYAINIVQSKYTLGGPATYQPIAIGRGRYG